PTCARPATCRCDAIAARLRADLVLGPASPTRDSGAMKHAAPLPWPLLCLAAPVASAATHHVTPDEPAALYELVDAVRPGDVIELADGTYTLTDTIKLRVDGKQRSPIRLVAAEGAKPVLDFSQQEADS